MFDIVTIQTPARARLRRLLFGGAAVALFAAGATSMQLVNASGSATRSVYLPIAPCRLLDTRVAPDNVGSRNLPLSPGEVTTFQVWGTNGNCTIPTSATGIATNVTAVGPSSASYLTVYPADAARPLASNLNWIAGSPPTPNQVTVGLSSTGAISTFNNAGFVDIVIDIVGYYEAAPTGSGAQGPPGSNGTNGTNGGPGPAGPAGPVNRISNAQIATERWDQDPGRPATINTGSAPAGVAFDGTDIWVVNNGGDSVTKIDPVTDTVIVTLPVTSSPYSIAFDGTFIWVSIGSNGTVDKINPATNAVIDVVAVGPVPRGMAFDGRYLWVANSTSAASSVSKIDTTTDSVVQTITAGISQPLDVAFDGTRIWVVNAGSNSVVRLDRSTGAVIGGQITVGTSPDSIAFDGQSMWVTNYTSGTLTRVDAATGATVNPAISGMASAAGVAYDGGHIWVAGNNAVYVITPSTLGVQTVMTAAATGIVFDGTNIWVTHNAQNTVQKLLPL
ncbi:MAG: hypothetical protein JWM34_2582 [Ilumatobacteraceae bacterium]|nr:hypothetical protein [Ilumatobacteraceae bacterium]